MLRRRWSVPSLLRGVAGWLSEGSLRRAVPEVHEVGRVLGDVHNACVSPFAAAWPCGRNVIIGQRLRESGELGLQLSNLILELPE